MDIDSFIVQVKTEDVYADLVEDNEITFDISNYEIVRPLPIGENRKVILLMKDEIRGRLMKEFVALRSKMHSYQINGHCVDKKSKVKRKCLIKLETKFEDHKSIWRKIKPY